jgi:hypothetical protein
MSTGTAQPRDESERRADEQAREEIRELFARYRRIARHGTVSERDEQPAPRPPQRGTPPPTQKPPRG